MKKALTIERLQAEWRNLHDLDRAEAVRALHNSGPSIREIGRQLHVSDSGLCRLLVALDAPVEDKLRARNGEITTSELVRRSKASGRARAARNREELKLERGRQALHAADLICKWLIATQMNAPNREMIVEEARLRFHGVIPVELNRSRQFAPDTQIEDIIVQTKPPKFKEQHKTDIAGWFAAWLCQWTFYAFRDQDVRDDALDLALERQRAG